MTCKKEMEEHTDCHYEDGDFPCDSCSYQTNNTRHWRNHIDETVCTRDEFNEMIPVQYSEYQISKKGDLLNGKLFPLN